MQERLQEAWLPILCAIWQLEQPAKVIASHLSKFPGLLKHAEDSRLCTGV